MYTVYVKIGGKHPCESETCDAKNRMIEICIGSACHLKGSYHVIQKLRELIEKNKLTDMELKSAFCLGACGDGVSIRVNKEKVYSVKMEEVETFFFSEILDGRL